MKFATWRDRLTGKYQPYPHQYTELQREYVKHKVAVVVVRHTVVDPRTVTAEVSSIYLNINQLLTDHSSQRIAHTSCSAYYARACAPYN